MFSDDDDRTDARRGLVLLTFLIVVPVLGAAGALGLALVSILMG